jgi:hypothetical protein
MPGLDGNDYLAAYFDKKVRAVTRSRAAAPSCWARAQCAQLPGSSPPGAGCADAAAPGPRRAAATATVQVNDDSARVSLPMDAWRFQKRFFVLSDSQRSLYYFKSPDDVPKTNGLRGQISLADCVVEDLDDRGMPRPWTAKAPAGARVWHPGPWPGAWPGAPGLAWPGPAALEPQAPLTRAHTRLAREALPGEALPRQGPHSRASPPPAPADLGRDEKLLLRIRHKDPKRSIVKEHNHILLRAENVLTKFEWISRMMSICAGGAPAKQADAAAANGRWGGQEAGEGPIGGRSGPAGWASFAALCSGQQAVHCWRCAAGVPGASSPATSRSDHSSQHPCATPSQQPVAQQPPLQTPLSPPPPPPPPPHTRSLPSRRLQRAPPPHHHKRRGVRHHWRRRPQRQPGHTGRRRRRRELRWRERRAGAGRPRHAVGRGVCRLGGGWGGGGRGLAGRNGAAPCRRGALRLRWEQAPALMEAGGGQVAAAIGRLPWSSCVAPDVHWSLALTPGGARSARRACARLAARCGTPSLAGALC